MTCARTPAVATRAVLVLSRVTEGNWFIMVVKRRLSNDCGITVGTGRREQVDELRQCLPQTCAHVRANQLQAREAPR